MISSPDIVIFGAIKFATRNAPLLRVGASQT